MSATIVHPDRYWWHEAIARELERISTCTTPLNGYNAAGIAGNLRGFTFSDTMKYCEQMVSWGELVPIEPLWDYAPGTWFALTAL